MIGYPAIMTAYFFHQRFIADVKGWSLELLAEQHHAYSRWSPWSLP